MLSTKISTWFKYFIYFFTGIILFIMLVPTVLIDLNSINILNILISIIFTLLIINISIKLNRYSPKLFISLLVAISSILYLIWNLYAKTTPVSDYQVIFEGANKIIDGTFHTESFDKTSYFYFYNYQIGYTVYVASVIFIFGNNLVAFKILEALYITCTSLLIYKIADKLWSKDSAAIASILYALFIPNIIGSSIINNQHLSTLTLMLAIYFFIKDTKLSTIFLGILLAITQILRPISIIPIIAIVMIYIYRLIKEKNYKKYISSFLILIISFMVITKTFDFTLMQLKLSPSPISRSNAKYFKFVLGLKGEGLYKIPTESARKTQIYFDLEKLDFDYDKYNDLCLQEVKNSIKDFKSILNYVVRKMIVFMSFKDNQIDFAVSGEKLTTIIFMLTDIGKVQYTLLLLFTFISILLARKSSESDINILYILIIGFVLVHIFIEVQTRYRYELYVFFTIISSYSLNNLWAKLDKIGMFRKRSNALTMKE